MNGEFMTKKGYQKLIAKEKELKQKLKTAREITKDEADKSNDWYDNSNYEQQIQEAQRLSNQIAKIREQIKNAKILEDEQAKKGITGNIDKVIIGSIVTVDIEGDIEKYLIAGQVDSNPFQGVISYKAPLAEAILGCKVGDEKVVVIKNSSFKIKVLKVESNNHTENIEIQI